MKAFDIMEALTDVDDAALLRAEQDPPRHRAAFSGFLRYAAAACLGLVLVIMIIVPIHTDARDNKLSWTLEVDEDGFGYEFWDKSQPEQSPPNYAPTWVPEGFQLIETMTFDGRDRTLLYWLPEQEHLSFSCDYVGKGSSYTYSVGKSYGDLTLEQVMVGPFEADHYRYEHGNGYLIWVDPDQQLFFVLAYGKICGAENALRIARSIEIIQEDKK